MASGCKKEKKKRKEIVSTSRYVRIYSNEALSLCCSSLYYESLLSLFIFSGCFLSSFVCVVHNPLELKYWNYSDLWLYVLYISPLPVLISKKISLNFKHRNHYFGLINDIGFGHFRKVIIGPPKNKVVLLIQASLNFRSYLVLKFISVFLAVKKKIINLLILAKVR